MSDFAVEVTKVAQIFPHPNAHSLEIACFKGWQCVVQKDRYCVGDLVAYFPIDSVLPEALEAFIFGPTSKVKLHNHRIKTIKLRGAISQGLVVDLNTIDNYLHAVNGDHNLDDYEEGEDLSFCLRVSKYEPPVPEFQKFSGSAQAPKSYKNPNFKTYFKMGNFKNYLELFQPEDQVVITEKIHGTNFRAGWVPFHANTFWRVVQKFLGIAPKWVFVYGSHNVQISEKMLYNGFYGRNVYAEAVVNYGLKDKIPKGLVIYGEIYGAGIQKGYHYGTVVERKLLVFDAMDSATGEYLSYPDFQKEVGMMGLKQAPVLYIGPYSKADVSKLSEGCSVLAPTQPVREGCVVKSLKEEQCYAGRKMLKVINPEYLLGDQSDFH